MSTLRRPTSSQVLEATGVLLFLGTLALGVLGTLPEEPHFEVGREVFGNIPDPAVFLFYVGTGAFLWLTLHLFAQRAAGWQQGGEDARTGRWEARLRRLYEGLTMRTVVRDARAGVMHSMIYYGFVVLFLGTATLELDHLAPSSLKFLHGNFYLGYSAVLDLAAIVYLGGLGSMGGALAGGLLLGVVEAIGMHFTSPSLKSLLSYTVFIAVLLLRPNGLFHRKR